MTSRRPLRIGIIAPPWVPVPPLTYGGTELVLDALCRGLARRGHDVVLFTVGESTCDVPRASLFDRADPDRMGACVLELRHASAAYDAFGSMDLVHDHTVAGLFLRDRHRTPVVTTSHGPFDADLADIYRRVSDAVSLVAISHDQAARAPDGLTVNAVIHHGVDLDLYPPSIGGVRSDDLVFIGRMSQDKGVATAIEVARLSGRPLRVAAKMREPGEHRYFREVIEPRLSSDIEYVGEVGHDEKVALLQSASALVNPISWPEPFGMVMAESLACGTPVVGYRAGAAPEIVDHGVTGILGTCPHELVRGLDSIDSIERGACRRSVEQRFSMDRMARDHETLYRRVLPPSSADVESDFDIDLRTQDTGDERRPAGTGFRSVA